ncbi:MAG TPA: Crp/Fnr family transcriptional regulator [Aggregatilineaceae bacterium]|nr:Crp/Fnr family transcriptional regulator [Aggregatilineaceae bacterium]
MKTDLPARYIRAFALDQHLNQDLLRCLKVYQYAPQVEFYVQTDEQTIIYLLVAGKVQINHYHANGKLSVLAMMTPLAVIGDLELFSYEAIKTNVITLEESVLLGIEKGFALKYGADDPRFLRFIIQHLTAKLYQTSRIHTGNVLPLIKRLAAYLLEQDEDVIALSSKSHLAGLLGTTPRHLNRVLNTLADEGSIQPSPHTIRILKRDSLKRRTES